MCFSTVSQRGRFWFRFRFLENGSGGSGSAFGSCENPEGPNPLIERKSISLERLKISRFRLKFSSFRLKTSISLEIFNLDLENSPTKIGFGGWLA